MMRSSKFKKLHRNLEQTRRSLSTRRNSVLQKKLRIWATQLNAVQVSESNLITFLVVKNKGPKTGAFSKEEKWVEVINTDIQNNQVKDNIDHKEPELTDEKQDKPSVLLKESNHSFIMKNFKIEEHLLASIESHEFMDNPHKVLEKSKENRDHFESEDHHQYDFEMDHNEYIGEYNHIHQKQIESSIDNRFEFVEAHDNDHELPENLFLNDEFMNHQRQFE